MKNCFIKRVTSLRASLYIQCKFKGSYCIEPIWARLSTYNTMYFESELKDRLKFGVCIASLLTSSRFPAESGPSLYCSISIDVKMAPYSCSWLLAASISFVLYALNDSGASGLTSEHRIVAYCLSASLRRQEIPKNGVLPALSDSLQLWQLATMLCVPTNCMWASAVIGCDCGKDHRTMTSVTAMADRT